MQLTSGCPSFCFILLLWANKVLGACILIKTKQTGSKLHDWGMCLLLPLSASDWAVTYSSKMDPWNSHQAHCTTGRRWPVRKRSMQIRTWEHIGASCLIFIVGLVLQMRQLPSDWKLSPKRQTTVSCKYRNALHFLVEVQSKLNILRILFLASGVLVFLSVQSTETVRYICEPKWFQYLAVKSISTSPLLSVHSRLLKYFKSLKRSPDADKLYSIVINKMRFEKTFSSEFFAWQSLRWDIHRHPWSTQCSIPFAKYNSWLNWLAVVT